MKMLALFLSIASFLVSKPLEINITANSAMLMNAESGAILYEKNGHKLVHPASLTKVATALFALEEKKLDLHKVVQVSAEALKCNPGKRTDETIPYWHESDASMMGLVRGELITIEALMHGLMLVSGNDAANVIAEAASGSVSGFVKELNEYVQKLGCKNTHFMNPHGYRHSEHLSTPYDLCIVMKAALKSPALKQIMSKSSYVKPKTNKQPEGELKQSNSLINPLKKHFYLKAVAGKTGYHRLAGECSLSAAIHEDRQLIACVMGCEKGGTRFSESRKLYDAAFNEKKMELLLVDGHQKFTKELMGAKTKLIASLSKNLSIAYYPSEEPRVKAFISWNVPSLPIRKGDVVGHVLISNESGDVVVQEELYAVGPVFSTFLFSMKEKFCRLFQ